VAAAKLPICTLACALTTALLTTAGCFGPRSEGPVKLTPQSESTEWSNTLAEHTRRAEPYRWAMRQADMRATLVTPRLRAAYVRHRSEFHGQFAEKTERELVAMGEADEGVDAAMKPGPDAEQQVVVFVAMYVADQKNRDIAASYTIWDTQLARGDAVVKPLKIETVRSSPAVSAIFPYVDRFDDLYLVRFPLVDAQGVPLVSPGGEPLELQVKSALADARVAWSLSE
jgi:hypothetical protein